MHIFIIYNSLHDQNFSYSLFTTQDRNFIEIKDSDEHFDIISKLSVIYSAINMSDYDVNVRYLMPHSDRLKRGKKYSIFVFDFVLISSHDFKNLES